VDRLVGLLVNLGEESDGDPPAGIHPAKCLMDDSS
jgi:hypothetical protein